MAFCGNFQVWVKATPILLFLVSFGILVTFYNNHCATFLSAMQNYNIFENVEKYNVGQYNNASTIIKFEKSNARFREKKASFYFYNYSKIHTTNNNLESIRFVTLLPKKLEHVMLALAIISKIGMHNKWNVEVYFGACIQESALQITEIDALHKASSIFEHVSILCVQNQPYGKIINQLVSTKDAQQSSYIFLSDYGSLHEIQEKHKVLGGF